MKSCTFFGHRHIYEKIEVALETLLMKLIENNVSIFYIGSQGDFDHIVINILKSLKNIYPHICYYVVLAYIPTEKNNHITDNYENTIYPDGLEFVPPKYAILKRNRWMIENSDYVVFYNKNSLSNTAKLKTISEKLGKIVIDII